MHRAASVEKVAGIIENEFGLYYPPNRYEDLLRGLSGASSILYGNSDSAVIINEILQNGSVPDNISEQLVSSLTITETYFFREAPSISLFINKIVPEIKEKDGEFRIWCAGCSSGEEPYSLAMLLRDNLNSTQLEKIRILATDLNHNALEKARNGIYTEWSFRETSAEFKERYFKNSHGKWIIDGKIKKMVEFGKLNLVRDFSLDKIGFQGFDLIFCRNVLMYFSSDVIKSITRKFNDLLPEGGWLIVSQVELNDEYFGKFTKFSYENGIFYKKVSGVKSIPTIKKGHITQTRKEIKTVTSKPQIKYKIQSDIKVSEGSTNETGNFSELETLYNKGRYDECIDKCLYYSDNKKNTNQITMFLAKCYANRGEYSKSIESIDKIVASGGSGEDIYYLYGTVLKEQRETKKAIEAFKKVLYINPDHLFSNLLLGNILSEDGNEEKASRYYKNVLEILSKIDDSHIIPESGGLTKRRFVEMVDNLIGKYRR